MPKKLLNSPFLLEIKSSPQKILLIVLPHLFLIFLVSGLSFFTLSLKLFLVILITTSAHYYYRYHIACTPNKAVTQLRQDATKNWIIATLDKQKKLTLFSAHILPSSFVSQWLIILNLIDNSGSKYTVIFTPDSISNNDFRHLFIRLKLTNIKKS